MSILERLKSDMIEATKARNSERLGVIRFVRSEMLNRKIELGRDLDDEDAVEVLARLAKRHRESIAQFGPAGRNDLVAKEEAGLAVVSEYLPEQLGEAELSSLVDEAIAESGATSIREMGLVMKSVMPKVKGRADGTAVKALVQQRLAGGEG
jgi:uncharacterized protein YqeY